MAQCPIPNPNSLPEYNMLFQIPIKQFEWSLGKVPNNQLLQPQRFLSPTQLNKDNLLLNKKSIEEIYKLAPISQLKYSNSSNNSSNNSNNNNNNIINKGNNNNGNALHNNALGNNNINNNRLNNRNYSNDYNNININNSSNNHNNNDIL